MLTWFALGFGFYLQCLAGITSRESWASCRKKKRKEEGMFRVWLRAVPDKSDVKFPFSCKQQRNGSSWGSCTGCILCI